MCLNALTFEDTKYRETLCIFKNMTGDNSVEAIIPSIDKGLDWPYVIGYVQSWVRERTDLGGFGAFFGQRLRNRGIQFHETEMVMV